MKSQKHKGFVLVQERKLFNKKKSKIKQYVWLYILLNLLFLSQKTVPETEGTFNDIEKNNLQDLQVALRNDQQNNQKHDQNLANPTIEGNFKQEKNTQSHQNQDRNKAKKDQDNLQQKTIKFPIIELNQLNFNSVINQFDHVVVYFSSSQCHYCDQFDDAYNHIQEKNGQNQSINSHNIIKYTKLVLNQNTQQIFKQFQITTVPEIRYFHKGSYKNYSLNFIQYDHSSIDDIVQWTKRIIKISNYQSQIQNLQGLQSSRKFNSTYFFNTQINSLQQVQEQIIINNKKALIFNCTTQQKPKQNTQLTSFLKNLHLKHLNHQFYCTNNRSILQNQDKQTVQIYGLTPGVDNINQTINKQNPNQKLHLTNTIDLEKQLEYLTKNVFEKSTQTESIVKDLKYIYQQNINRYFYQEIQQWSNKSILSIFTDFQPGFLLIVNNQTNSRAVSSLYQLIKNQFNQNGQIPPIMFYQTDLSTRPQQTTRIKKHILGLSASIAKQYPYPYLAYLKEKNGTITKYLFPFDKKLNQQNMRKWMINVIYQLQLVMSQKQQNKVYQDHNQFQQQKNFINPVEFYKQSPQTYFSKDYMSNFSLIIHNNSYIEAQKQQLLKIPEQFTKAINLINLLSYDDFNVLLSKYYKKPFFVYINWKNDVNSYFVLQDLIEWWEQTQKDQEQQNQNSENLPSKQQKDHQIQQQKQSQKQQIQEQNVNKKQQDVDQNVVKNEKEENKNQQKKEQWTNLNVFKNQVHNSHHPELQNVKNNSLKTKEKQYEKDIVNPEAVSLEEDKILNNQQLQKHNPQAQKHNLHTKQSKSYQVQNHKQRHLQQILIPNQQQKINNFSHIKQQQEKVNQQKLLRQSNHIHPQKISQDKGNAKPAQQQNKKNKAEQKIQNKDKEQKKQNQDEKVQKQESKKSNKKHKISPSKQIVQDLYNRASMYQLNLNNNDYPRTYTDIQGKQHVLNIDHIPGLMYFSHDKKNMQLIEGIENIDQIKEFIVKMIMPQRLQQYTNILFQQKVKNNQRHDIKQLSNKKQQSMKAQMNSDKVIKEKNNSQTHILLEMPNKQEQNLKNQLKLDVQMENIQNKQTKDQAENLDRTNQQKADTKQKESIKSQQQNLYDRQLQDIDPKMVEK